METKNIFKNIITCVQEDQGKLNVKNENMESTIQFFYLLSDNLTFNTSIILDICNDTNWYNTSVSSDLDRDANFSSLHWFSMLVVISFITLSSTKFTISLTILDV